LGRQYIPGDPCAAAVTPTINATTKLKRETNVLMADLRHASTDAHSAQRQHAGQVGQALEQSAQLSAASPLAERSTSHHRGE
jgi:hypothetical protein